MRVTAESLPPVMRETVEPLSAVVRLTALSDAVIRVTELAELAVVLVTPIVVVALASERVTLVTPQVVSCTHIENNEFT